VPAEQRWLECPQFVFVLEGKGGLSMPAPPLDDLAGLVNGVRQEGFRHRNERHGCAHRSASLASRHGCHGVHRMAGRRGAKQEARW
jgi:hypothetical protein